MRKSTHVFWKAYYFACIGESQEKIVRTHAQNRLTANPKATGLDNYFSELALICTRGRISLHKRRAISDRQMNKTRYDCKADSHEPNRHVASLCIKESAA